MDAIESGQRYPVRCPSERCGDLFDVPQARLGRNIYCPSCGVRMTARPAEVERKLELRQRAVRGRDDTSVPRLPLAVLVDNVRSLWNVGSIFRTADACGLERVVLAGITGCPPEPRIAKTALGAEQTVAWSYHADPLEALERASGRGFTPVAVERSDRAIPLDAFEWPERVCLVIGNEVSGVTPQLLEACLSHVSIPMLGVKDSLNVAVAFGIAAYHAARALESRTVEIGARRESRA